VRHPPTPIAVRCSRSTVEHIALTPTLHGVMSCGQDFDGSRKPGLYRIRRHAHVHPGSLRAHAERLPVLKAVVSLRMRVGSWRCRRPGYVDRFFTGALPGLAKCRRTACAKRNSTQEAQPSYCDQMPGWFERRDSRRPDRRRVERGGRRRTDGSWFAPPHVAQCPRCGSSEGQRQSFSTRADVSTATYLCRDCGHEFNRVDER
jgi:hypothetical protein